MPGTLDPHYRKDLRYLLALIAAEDHATLVTIAIGIGPTTRADPNRRLELIGEYEELREIALEAATLRNTDDEDELTSVEDES